MERFLKLSDVQSMLGVSRSTLWRWTAENGLKVVRVGNVTRIRESELEAFLKRFEPGTIEDARTEEDSMIEAKRAIESSPSPHSTRNVPLK
jgi:excisionase family DNA binding protein